MTGYMLIIGSVFLFMISLLTEPNGLKSLASGSIKIWAVFFASALLATAFGQLVYNSAVGSIGAAETSIFINLMPLFSLIGAAVFLGENITLSQIIGFLFILTGVVLGTDVWKEISRIAQQKRKVHITN
jgi:drug/metabolite transporter (DMT)-like permease